MFTILVSVAAVEWLFVHHPKAAPFTLNPGTSSGSDVLGQQETLAAEVFAAVRPTNNRKLNRDIEKVAGASVTARYVFYYCPNDWCDPHDATSDASVRIVPLTRDAILGIGSSQRKPMDDAPLRDTPYATELGHGSVMFPSGTEGRIERLRFKRGLSAGREGIRFSWWKDDRMAPRPLDATEGELLALLRSSLQHGVLSDRFQAELRQLLKQEGA